MSAILVLARREIVRGRRGWLAAAALGLVPVVVALASNGSEAAAYTRGALALELAVAVGVGYAIVLGASLFGPDLAQGRMGFDLARPVSTFAIWTGRLAGAWVLATVGVTLVVVPSLVAGARVRGGGAVSGGAWTVVLATAAALLVVIMAAHAVSLALRARSPRLFLDVLGLATFLGLVVVAVLRLLNAGLEDVVGSADALVAAVIVVALFAAGATSLARGRADVARCHAVSQTVLWCALLPAAIGLELRSRWIVAATPRDLDLVAADGAVDGAWVALRGSLHDRPGMHPVFLVEAGTGRWARLEDAVSTPVFSGDGKVAAWAASLGVLAGDAVGVSTMRLEAGDLRSRRTGVRYEGTTWVDFALSADGALVAAVDAHRLVVHEVETARPVAVAWISERSTCTAQIAFTSPTRVRAWRYPAPLERDGDVALEIFELDLATGRLERTGSAPPAHVAAMYSLRVDLASERMLVGGGGERLRDARSGAVVAELALPPGTKPGRCHHLHASGRVVVGTEDGVLHVFDARGAHLRAIDLGGSRELGVVRIANGARTDEAVVGLSRWVGSTEDRRAVVVVDLSTGAHRVLGEGISLVPEWDLRRAAVPAALPSRAFYQHDGGAVMTVDLTTGAELPVWRPTR